VIKTDYESRHGQAVQDALRCESDDRIDVVANDYLMVCCPPIHLAVEGSDLHHDGVRELLVREQ
jgi:hypothetical protein